MASMRALMEQLEQEESDPPEPPSDPLKRSIAKDSQSLKSDNIVPFGKASLKGIPNPTELDRQLVHYLRLANGIPTVHPDEEYEEVQEVNPTLAVVAEGTTPSSDDDEVLYQKWLQDNTQKRYTEKIYTERYDAFDVFGNRYDAYRRMRQVRVNRRVRNQDGTYSKKVGYKLVPDTLVRTTKVVRIKGTAGKGFCDGSILMEKTVYGMEYHSPLRHPFTCATYLSKDYFTNPKYAKGFRITCKRNSKKSKAKREELGKSQIYGEFDGLVPNRSVAWHCRNPSGKSPLTDAFYPGHEERLGIYGTEEDQANTDIANALNECKADEALAWLHVNQIDLSEESALRYHDEKDVTYSTHHKRSPNYDLVNRRSVVDAGLKEHFEALMDEGVLAPLPEKHSDIEEEVTLAYEGTAANEEYVDDVPFRSIDAVPFEPSENAESEGTSEHIDEGIQEDELNLSPRRSMSGWQLPRGINGYKEHWFEGRELSHIPCRNSRLEREVRAEESNQFKPMQEGTCYVTPSGVVSRAISVPTLEHAGKIGDGLMRLKSRSSNEIEMPEVKRLSDNVVRLIVNGINHDINVSNEAGINYLRSLIDQQVKILDTLLEFEPPMEIPSSYEMVREVKPVHNSKSDKRTMLLSDIMFVRIPDLPKDVIPAPYPAAKRLRRKNYAKFLNTQKNMEHLGRAKRLVKLERIRQTKLAEFKKLANLKHYQEEVCPVIAREETLSLMDMGRKARQRALKKKLKQRRLERQLKALKRSQQIEVNSEIGWLSRRAHYKPTKGKRWLKMCKLRASIWVKLKLGLISTPSNDVSIPPTVGEGGQVLPKVEVKKEELQVRKPSVPLVLPERNDQETASKLIKSAAEITITDAMKLAHVQKMLSSAGTTQNLEDEVARTIYRASIAEKMAMRREKRLSLAA
tara:strand:- start:19055 stop:21790 length:2736 start_codon:yes stop_codon:yes gene_type:complete